MNIKGQGYSLTLVQGHLDSSFSNFFFLQTALPTEATFYVEPPWDGGMIRLFKWPPCPYMVKTLKNLLLWNQKADDLKSWYVALGTLVLPSLFK